MPYRAKKLCNHPSCSVAIRASSAYCPKHLPMHRNDYPRKRPINRAYTASRWKKYRRWYLNRHPVCAILGCNEMATVIDHIVPVNEGGDFWSMENHQALCAKHHSEKTAKEDGGWGNIKK